MPPSKAKPVPPPAPDDFLLPITPVGAAYLKWGHLPHNHVREDEPIYLRLTRYDQRFLSRIGIRWRY